MHSRGGLNRVDNRTIRSLAIALPGLRRRPRSGVPERWLNEGNGCVLWKGASKRWPKGTAGSRSTLELIRRNEALHEDEELPVLDQASLAGLLGGPDELCAE